MSPGLDVVLAIRDLFSRYRLEQITTSTRKYWLTLVYEFYASYISIVIETIPKKDKPIHNHV